MSKRPIARARGASNRQVRGTTPRRSVTPQRSYHLQTQLTGLKITFGKGDVDDLISAIKKPLLEMLKDADVTLCKHGEDTDLQPGLPVDNCFRNSSTIPLHVIVM
ncbi:hypothetical protein G9A89_001273 [Geosiphon pyriformis]|nr:hypothetical protein G9A89_001273 [Geosiphon pyriformis]